MKGNVLETPYGEVVLSEEVLANIAGISAVECYGLVGMASRKLKDGINEMLKKEDLRKGVEIKIFEDRLVIELYVIVSYGLKISEVAHNVMEKVKYSVEHLTGLEVHEVNVNVKGVRVQD